MKVIPAEITDIPKLYQLQLIAFESEAEMIGSRDVPALQETEEENRLDFKNWNTLKMENDDSKIIGAIRYRQRVGVTFNYMKKWVINHIKNIRMQVVFHLCI